MLGSLHSCLQDPSPDGFLVPQFSGISIDESVPGVVTFHCGVSSMEQISDFGLYFTTAGTTTAGTKTAATKTAGTKTAGSKTSAGTKSSATKTSGTLARPASKASDPLWTRVQGTRDSDESFTVSIESLLGGATYSCRLYIGNGRVERLSEPLSYSAPDNGSGRAPMVLRVAPGSDGAVYLPLRGNVKCVIDWGDGSREACTGDFGIGSLASGYVSHTYELPDAYSGPTSYPDASAAKAPAWMEEPTFYEVSISGTVTALSTSGLPDCSTIEAVLDWGDTGLQDLSCAFSDCTRLESLAVPAPGTFSNVSSLRDAFSGTSLWSLPNGLFDDVPDGCDCSRTFEGCTLLHSLPEGLLPATESLRQTFKGCTALETLPSKLIKGAREMQETFAGCSSLRTLPDDLLQGSPELERFVSVFAGCSALESLPAALFDPCRGLGSVEGAFMNCASLRGESPATVIKGTKVHLYERSAYPEEFVPIEKYYLCFFGCLTLDDYPQMPQNWKKP